MSYPSALTSSGKAASLPYSRGQKVSLKSDNRQHYISHFYPSLIFIPVPATGLGAPKPLRYTCKGF